MWWCRLTGSLQRQEGQACSASAICAKERKEKGWEVFLCWRKHDAEADGGRGGCRMTALGPICGHSHA